MADTVAMRVSAGRGETVSVELPRENVMPVPQRPRSPGLKDVPSAIREAVASAVDVAGINRDRRTPNGRVCIVVPDRSRTMPVRATVEAFLRALDERGVPASRVSVVIATGTHPPMALPDIEAHVGPDVVAAVDVKNHDFRDARRLVQAGDDVSIAGTRLPVVVNRDVWDADVVLGVGSVRPHRAVGWSGGAKIILPGVASEKTIEPWHWLGWGFPREVIHEQVENPMRAAVELIGERAGLKAVVNFVMNWRDEPLAVFGGGYVEAHRRAAAIAVQDYRIDVKERSDILILGSPASSTTLYPSVAQLQQAPRFVKRGGTVILLSACADGVAPNLPQIGEVGYHPPAEVRKLVERGRLTSLIAASHIMYVSEGLFGHELECILVSRSLDEGVAERLGLEYAESAEAAVERAFAKHGRRSTVRVIPHQSQPGTER